MRYVVLGASAAGINGVRQLRKQCPEAEIILVSKDSSIYSRCILHHYLGNMRTKEELCFAEDDFEDRYKADWRKGVTCTGLDDFVNNRFHIDKIFRVIDGTAQNEN